MESEILAQIITVGGPVAAIAILAIYINWRIVLKWAEDRNNLVDMWAEERTEILNKLLTTMTELVSVIRRVESIIDDCRFPRE
jgi:hypothetical protein